MKLTVELISQLKIAVLMGGKSAERPVSLRSGKAVYDALKMAGMNVVAYDVQSLEDLKALEGQCDIAFLALHGRWGEDGVVQAVLSDLGIPFTGSKMAASALGMDKLRSKWMWLGAGLPTPKFKYISPEQSIVESEFDLNFPVMVKPAHEGSSIGMRKVYNFAELLDAITFAQGFDGEVLIEEWIFGREFTCAVLGDQALPLIELKTTHDFYDYEAKYQANDTQYICPCELPAKVREKIHHIVLNAFKVIGCEGWGRVDLMLDDQMHPWLIEINTAPGMTDHSLVPMAAKEHGMTFVELILTILMLAWQSKSSD